MEAWITEKKTGDLASWISPSEVETHHKIINGGGYTGPLNWYKQGMAGVTHAAEAKLNPDYASTRFAVPTLLIACENDMICRPMVQEHGMKDFFDDLTVKSLKTSHWVMIEQPKEMWEILQSWVEEQGKKA
jgi:soluble epoxide hydrolase/lipid-phosphate phosphatase